MFRIVFAFALLAAGSAAAQEHQHPAPAPAAQDHAHHAEQAGESLFPARDASGTSWLPRQTPMHAGHARAGSWELMWHGNGVPAVHQRVGAGASRRAPDRQHQLGDGHGSPPCRRRPCRRAHDAQPRAVDDSRLRLSRSAGDGRNVRRRHDSRSPAPARPLHGAGARVRASARPAAFAGLLRRPGRRAGTRSGGVSASRLGDVQSDRADRASLARRDAHHLRCDHVPAA